MCSTDSASDWCEPTRRTMEVSWCASLLLVVVLPTLVHSWDVVVASEGRLDTLTASGELGEIETPTPVGSLVSLAVSPRHERLYLGDNSHPNASVLELELSSGVMRPVVPKQSADVHGLALDPLKNVLFWTTGYGHSIMQMRLDGQSDFRKRINKTLHKFREEIPQGIAVDTCGRYLFWTNSNQRAPSIERSNLDGSNRVAIVSKDLFMPLGVAVDQAERKLYWSQELEGVYYSIERSDLDGSNREVVVRSMHHQPFTLTIGPDFIYWSDWTHNAIWKKSKKDHSDGSEPIRVHQFESAPMGIVANVEGEATTDVECRKLLAAYEAARAAALAPAFTTFGPEEVTEADWNDDAASESEDFCLNSGAVLRTKDHGAVCRCLPGYTGVRCEIELCFNYCIHGACSMDSRGGATCRCDAGYSGHRCERNVCSDYCLNGGVCSVSNGIPTCECLGAHQGKRCELSSNLNKLCQLYCESELAVIPLHASQGGRPLCVCPTAESVEYNVEGLNASALVLTRGSSHPNDQNSVFTNPIVLMFLVCSIALTFLSAYLTWRVRVLSKRPRIKKRFIGNKAVTPTPLTNRPTPATDQCEINIENCCNMNICETPCFEPNLRTSRPGSKREEKKTLLESMENSQDGPPDLY